MSTFQEGSTVCQNGSTAGIDQHSLASPGIMGLSEQEQIEFQKNMALLAHLLHPSFEKGILDASAVMPFSSDAIDHIQEKYVRVILEELPNADRNYQIAYLWLLGQVAEHTGHLPDVKPIVELLQSTDDKTLQRLAVALLLILNFHEPALALLLKRSMEGTLQNINDSDDMEFLSEFLWPKLVDIICDQSIDPLIGVLLWIVRHEDSLSGERYRKHILDPFFKRIKDVFVDLRNWVMERLQKQSGITFTVAAMLASRINLFYTSFDYTTIKNALFHTIANSVNKSDQDINVANLCAALYRTCPSNDYSADQSSLDQVIAESRLIEELFPLLESKSYRVRHQAVRVLRKAAASYWPEDQECSNNILRSLGKIYVAAPLPVKKASYEDIYNETRKTILEIFEFLCVRKVDLGEVIDNYLTAEHLGKRENTGLARTFLAMQNVKANNQLFAVLFGDSQSAVLNILHAIADPPRMNSLSKRGIKQVRDMLELATNPDIILLCLNILEPIEEHLPYSKFCSIISPLLSNPNIRIVEGALEVILRMKSGPTRSDLLIRYCASGSPFPEAINSITKHLSSSDMISSGFWFSLTGNVVWPTRS